MNLPMQRAVKSFTRVNRTPAAIKILAIMMQFHLPRIARGPENSAPTAAPAVVSA